MLFPCFVPETFSRQNLSFTLISLPFVKYCRHIWYGAADIYLEIFFKIQRRVFHGIGIKCYRLDDVCLKTDSIQRARYGPKSPTEKRTIFGYPNTPDKRTTAYVWPHTWVTPESKKLFGRPLFTYYSMAKTNLATVDTENSLLARLRPRLWLSHHRRTPLKIVIEIQWI